MRTALKCFLFAAAGYILFIGIYGCAEKKLFRETRVALGTYVEVISLDKRAGEVVFKELSRIEALLSKYNPDSEVSRLNRSGSLKVSPETFKIIKRSVEISKATHGAFDITVGPLVDIWGFTEHKFRVPRQEEIKQALRLVGWEKLVLIEQESVIKFKFPGMKIDLGGIAKGYAIDCAVEKLKKAGISDCLMIVGRSSPIVSLRQVV